MSEIKKLHDKRVQKETQTQGYTIPDYNTAYKCLNRARKRMTKQVGSLGLESFNHALDSADDAEIFTVWENGDLEEYRCIVKNLKDSWQQDTKYVSATKDVGFEVGNTITWKRLNLHWLIVWQDYNYRDYFRGEMYKATHLIKWVDDTGKVQQQWASVRGPVETKAKYDNVSGNYIGGRQNDTLELWIGKTSSASESLYRYELLKIGKRTWRIQVVDDISNPDVLRMSLIENFNNEDTDDVLLGIPDGEVIPPESTIDPVESYRIMGPATVKENLNATFKAYNNDDALVEGLWTVTIGTKAPVTYPDVSQIKVKGGKIGDVILINFSIGGETKAEVKVDTVSVFS